ncbi:DUF1904 family protein [Cohnella caldifontis]|uniref:DUF1904 family protein n=1 Tax=Cohnella caldifontis TaxID=3027471 RepID=UPI0023EACA04|nr:DUF1904 family protein [Cohnella sp. YIM B05605]
MPHLTFRGVSVEQVKAISVTLAAELAELCRCPREDILLEVSHTTAVVQGETAVSYPFVEAAWFDRGEEIRDRFAEIVDRHLRQAGIAESEIAFRIYRQDHYYINGRRAGECREEKSAAEWTKELAAEREENARLRESLRKAARKTAAPGSDSSMSSKLRDALRE